MTNMTLHCRRGLHLGHSAITVGKSKFKNAGIHVIHEGISKRGQKKCTYKICVRKIYLYIMTKANLGICAGVKTALYFERQALPGVGRRYGCFLW